MILSPTCKSAEDWWDIEKKYENKKEKTPKDLTVEATHTCDANACQTTTKTRCRVQTISS